MIGDTASFDTGGDDRNPKREAIWLSTSGAAPEIVQKEGETDE